ncbi:MAG: hypothetical protein ACRYFS_11685 [Janthinobacterium lividum]
MKTITIEVGFFDSEPVLMDAKVLAKYPDSCKAVLEVKHERLTAGMVLAADAALNRRRELFQETFDGTLKPGVTEGFAYARAVEIILKAAKEWTYRKKDGELIATTTDLTEETVMEVSPSIVSVIASRIEYPAIPTPAEVKAQGEG